MNGFDQKKAEILRGLQREASLSAARKRRARAAGGVCALALVAGGVWWGAPSAPSNAPLVTPIAPPPGGPVAGTDKRIVRTRVDLASYTISDDELVAALDESGDAYTLVWEANGPRLVEPAKNSDDAPANG